MKLTKEILKEFGYKYSKKDDTYYNNQIYFEAKDVKNMSLKKFITWEKDNSYKQGYFNGQLDLIEKGDK